MSYDVYILKAPYQSCDSDNWDECFEHFRKQKVILDETHELRGGTFEVGGTREAWLNITFNYYKHFVKFLGGEGINDLDGQKVKDTLPKLMEAVVKMKGKPNSDYWKSTEGNARQALVNLIMLALLSPETVNGYWHISK